MGNEITGEVNTSHMLGFHYGVETGDCLRWAQSEAARGQE